MKMATCELPVRIRSADMLHSVRLGRTLFDPYRAAREESEVIGARIWLRDLSVLLS